jgi:hypothetical protein
MHFRFRRSRVVTALATAVALTAAGAALAVATSSRPVGGSFRLFVTAKGVGSQASILVTGAIGDQGRTRSVTRAGKPQVHGPYLGLALSHGTVVVDPSKLEAAFGKGVKKNSRTCSGSVAVTARVPLVNGTRRYAHASGAARLTAAVGLLVPRYKSGPKAGKCNWTKARSAPLAFRQILYGTGHVSF